MRLGRVLVGTLTGTMVLAFLLGIQKGASRARQQAQLLPIAQGFRLGDTPPKLTSGFPMLRFSRSLTPEEERGKCVATPAPAFIENQGQWHSDVLYLCRLGGLDVWITKWGINYTFQKLEEKARLEGSRGPFPDEFAHDSYSLLGHRVLMRFQGHTTQPRAQGQGRLEGYYNYLIGNDSSKHATYVRRYQEAWVRDLYKGIDMRYYLENGRLRYDWLVQPGADPNQIVFSLEGSDRTYIDSAGRLVFTTRFGEVKLAELRVYQGPERRLVESRFIERPAGWSIALGPYDPSQLLVIDPLVYSTYIGGSVADVGYGIAVDGSGHAYITGSTNSTNYDVTPGAFQSSNGGGYEVFVTKLNPMGTGLVYSTYIGGNSTEEGRAIAVDASGHAYVAGYTFSTDYDVTSSAFQTSPGGDQEVFVTKLNPAGTGLVYSTYIGGSGREAAYGITVDANGHAYVTGNTRSNDYDVTPNAFQAANGGPSGTADVFVTKLNPTGSSLVYSTYIGGTGEDIGESIAIDTSGHAYVTGKTDSPNYDVTPGAFQASNSGGIDAFVTKLNPSGSSLVYSTYIGGSGNDSGLGITVDLNGHAYVVGRTSSNDYDITLGAFQTTYGGGGDVFVTKINPTGTGLVYSTYLGGSGTDDGRGIAIDASGHAYVTGTTNSSNYPVTTGAFQATNAGNSDAFVTKLNPTGSGLIYATYIGGSDYDIGYDIKVDTSGYAYITGRTDSPDYDVSLNAFQTASGGSYEVFVTKICHPITLSSAAGTNNQTVCVNSAITPITYSTVGATGVTLTGLPGGVNGSLSGNIVTIRGTPSTTGTFNYNVTLTGGCGSTSASGTLTVINCPTSLTKQDKTSLDWHIYTNTSASTLTIWTERGGFFELMNGTGQVLRTYEAGPGGHEITLYLTTGVYYVRERNSNTVQKVLMVD